MVIPDRKQNDIMTGEDDYIHTLWDDDVNNDDT